MLHTTADDGCFCINGFFSVACADSTASLRSVSSFRFKCAMIFESLFAFSNITN